jgi:hypothetical protein
MGAFSPNMMGQPLSILSHAALYCGLRNRQIESNDQDSPDNIHIESAIYAVSDPGAQGLSQHIVCRFAVSFTLSVPLAALSVESDFFGVAFVKNALSFGPDTHHSAICVKLHWDLWNGQILEAGKRYVFEAIGCLPPNSPRSIRTKNGGVDYAFKARVCGTQGRCSLRSLEKSIRVVNPYLTDHEAPPNLSHGTVVSEFIGATVDVGNGIIGFIEYPDQCYEGSITHPLPSHCQTKFCRYTSRSRGRRPRRSGSLQPSKFRSFSTSSTFCLPVQQETRSRFQIHIS